jgi:predicted membrane-bound mannosyltransferase
VVGVLALAGALRVLRAGEWSLWQDEETSVYFSQNLDRPFPGYFPLFFWLLGTLYQMTGVSVISGRLLSAGLGVLSVGLTYVCFRRLTSHSVALLAAVWLTVSLGHLFWSQSIRYYILVLVFQSLSMYWFAHGFERGRLWELALSNVALLLAVFSHFSAALLLPVFAGHLVLALLRRERGGAYTLVGYLAFATPFLIGSTLFAWRFLSFHESLSSLVTRSESTNVAGLLVRFAAYAGAPVLLLGISAPMLGRRVISPRLMQFFLIVAVLPIVELVVIAKLNLVSVLWYQAFFAVLGFAILAGLSLVGLYRSGYRRTAVVLTVTGLLYSTPLLVGYYTSMHGDRPRWREASAYLREEGGIRPEATDNPEIFSSVPGSVAFHLGVDPAQTMRSSVVRLLPPQPPSRPPQVAQWYVVEARIVPLAYRLWFAEHCVLRARFDAWTGPRDRTVLVHSCTPRQAHV